VPKVIRNPRDEGCLRADDDEVGLQRGRQIEEPFAVLRPHGVALPEARNAGVSRCRVQLLELRCLVQLPRERMLASPRTDQEHLHRWTLASALDGFEDPVAVEGDDRDVIADYQAAHEITQAFELGKDVEKEDIDRAVANYRELYEYLIEERAAP
jgi:hypothetical protein